MLLITPDEFLNWLEEEFNAPTTMLEKVVEKIPKVEAEPVRRGRWIEHKSKDWSGGGAYICSVCGYGYSWAGYHEANEFTYCPNCGANMEEA